MGRDTRYEGDPDRVAIVLPGRGYTPSMPLLYWSRRVLERRGWTVQELWWFDKLPTDMDEWRAWVHAMAAEAVDRERTARQVVLVGKSLGSLAIPLAAERALPGIWLTPLLSAPPAGLATAEIVRGAVAKLAAPTLLVGGTADRTWDSELARGSGHDVCEIADGDHSLEVPAGVEASVRAHAEVVHAVEAYVDKLATASSV